MVIDYPEIAVSPFSNGCGIQVKLLWLRKTAIRTGIEKTTVGKYQLRWQQAVFDQLARPINILENQVKQLGTLDQRLIKVGPLSNTENQWQWVKLPGARTVALLKDIMNSAIFP